MIFDGFRLRFTQGPGIFQQGLGHINVHTLAAHALQDTATQTNIVRPTLEDVKTIIAKTYYEGIIMKQVKVNG